MEGELKEGGQKVQASSYKLNKYWRCNTKLQLILLYDS